MKDVLFQYSIFRGKTPMIRHVIAEADLRPYVNAETMLSLKSGKTYVLAIPFAGGHVNILCRQPMEITCKQCRYNVYGLRSQLKRMAGRGSLGCHCKNNLRSLLGGA